MIDALGVANTLRSALPFFSLFLAWYVWSLRQQFVLRAEFKKENFITKEEFKDFKTKYHEKQDKQEKLLTELCTNINHIVKAIDKIESKIG